MVWIVWGFEGDSMKLSTLGYKFGIVWASDDRNGKLDPGFWSRERYQRKVAAQNPKERIRATYLG